MPSNATHPYILVVDDNEEIRELLELVLEEEGYEVRAVASGDEALKLVREQRPVLIISAFTRHLGGAARDQVAQIIPKPFYLNQILAEVKATLERDAGRRLQRAHAPQEGGAPS